MSVRSRTMDYFIELTTIQVTETLSQQLISLSSEKNVDGSSTTYYFDSEKYSRPHRVTVDKNMTVQEIDLTIPDVQRAEYQALLASLGTPEISTPTNERETILAFPSQGISVIIDLAKQPVELIKTPPKSAKAFAVEKLSDLPPIGKVVSPQSTVLSESPSGSLQNIVSQAILAFWWIPTVILFVVLAVLLVKKLRKPVQRRTELCKPVQRIPAIRIP